MPAITSPVAIKGLTQPGINPPDIIVDGSQCDACDGLVVVSGGSTIEGLAIVGFPGRGVVFDGSQTGLGGNTLESSYIGWDPSGVGFSGNDDAGVAIVDSPNNTIGDGTANGRVVIGGNGSVGDQTEVLITGSGSTGNSLVGNWIGLAPDGTTSADTMNGVVITGAAFDNTIGGKNTVGNTFYAFGQDAINVVNAGSGNVVAGNSIGLDATGAMNQHSDTGIGVSGSPNTIIGDSAVPPGFADPTFGNVDRRSDWGRRRLRHRSVGRDAARRQLHRHRPAGRLRARKRPGRAADLGDRPCHGRPWQHDQRQLVRRGPDRELIEPADRRQLDLRQRAQ